MQPKWHDSYTNLQRAVPAVWAARNSRRTGTCALSCQRNCLHLAHIALQIRRMVEHGQVVRIPLTSDHVVLVLPRCVQQPHAESYTKRHTRTLQVRPSPARLGRTV